MNKGILIYPVMILGIVVACSNQNTIEKVTIPATSDNRKEKVAPTGKVKHFRGALTGGMKGDSIFFDVNATGTKLENLTFKGYWRCNGKLEQERAAGPMGAFSLLKGKVNDHIAEPPDGGATAWRFDLEATIEENTANGKFRMNINALGCNTGTLQWTANAN